MYRKKEYEINFEAEEEENRIYSLYTNFSTANPIYPISSAFCCTVDSIDSGRLYRISITTFDEYKCTLVHKNVFYVSKILS